LLVVYAIYFANEDSEKKSWRRIGNYFLLFFMIFNAIVGMDTVGKQAYFMACGYSFLTVLMVVLLIYSILNVLRPQRNSIFIN
jgi:hypothetical protein